ncbi:MAG: YceI family protein [Deltaproteobacteria bacterium]|nr:MAG: YceI family protein [Deltaproteobacteria bacterium]TNF25715.1 MAG: YceI family protein [Deltaproteobacteria bacterium]
MKHINILVLMFSLIASTSLFAAATSFKVETKKSHLKWTGKKVTGKHFGKVSVKSGELKFEGNDLKGGEFLIDMTSITVDDLTNQEWNTKLVNHLKNDDFFSVDKHKEAKVTIKSVTLGKGVYNVTADLTIKGITKPVYFDADIQMKKDVVTAKANITINRTLWNVKYGSGKFFKDLGDKMIYDDVEIEVNLTAKK